MNDKAQISRQIKEYAYSLGFDACGFCKAEIVEVEQHKYIENWLAKDYNANMDYMAKNFDKRCNPLLLVENARTVISLALNYYPHTKQSDDAPQIAYYAYGKDYHEVMKQKLEQLFDAIKILYPTLEGRVFCDTAPILERYWAAKAGIGFIGKNSLLIIPKKGSYFFLGELIINEELTYDKPIYASCGNCTRCISSCPTQSIVEAKVIDAQRCISYQTIENKGKIDEEIIPKLHNRFYGCDICQQVCPWNKYARPHSTPAFDPSEAFLDLSFKLLDELDTEQYQRIFKTSAIKRAKQSGLKRNIEALKRTAL